MMELILVFILGLVIGGRVTSWIHTLATKEMLNDLGVKNEDLARLLKKQQQKLGIETTEENPELEVIEVRLEEHQGQLYAFRKDTDQFLGQGSDRDSLVQHISQRLKNVKLEISRDDGADLLQKNNT